MKLGDIAERLECSLKGDADLDITGVVGIERAETGHLTFVSNPKYASKARTTKASAVIVSPDFPDIPPATLRSGNPYLTFARAIELFYTAPQPARGVDPTARISAKAKIGENASIGPFVVIEDNVEIGKHCTIYPFVHISHGVRAGDHFKAYAHVSVREYCRIGNNVILQDGAKIGTDGYGYAKKDDGSYYKIVQSGIVVLEDDVEIGANSTSRSRHDWRNSYKAWRKNRQSRSNRAFFRRRRRWPTLCPGRTCGQFEDWPQRDPYRPGRRGRPSGNR